MFVSGRQSIGSPSTVPSLPTIGSPVDHRQSIVQPPLPSAAISPPQAANQANPRTANKAKLGPGNALRKNRKKCSPRLAVSKPGAALFASTEDRDRRRRCRPSRDQGVKSAPISAPFVPAPFRSLPDASFRKLPMFGEPSELRLTDGVRLTKSAELTTSPLPFVL